MVRSAAEVLGTLDANGTLEGLPFMPEMVASCGRRFTVERRAEKLCDTINNTLTSRRMADTVLLEGLRCDGAGHGGCQAECLFYWKEAWLRRVEASEGAVVDHDAAAVGALRKLAEANGTSSDGALHRYRCQATQMVAASVPLSTLDPRPYLREYACGNVGLGTFVRVMGRALIMQTAHHYGLLAMPPVKGPSSQTPATEPLNLQPGEWVRVKSREEIRATLTDKGRNRGLWFDREMLAMCGRTFRVHRRVEKIIDERTGQMINLQYPCFSLEGGVCSGELSTGRWFCPREIPAYFRECWLERVSGPAANALPEGARFG